MNEILIKLNRVGLNPNIAPFNFAEFQDGFLITNITRDVCYLTKTEFSSFLLGECGLSEEKSKELNEKYFLKSSDYEAFLGKTSLIYRKTRLTLFEATSLHIFVVTLECNLNCVYCQAASCAKSTNMTEEIAMKSVDMALASPADRLTFEFQGGEPLANFPIIQIIVDYANHANKILNKKIKFSVISNLLVMTDEILDYLIRNNVFICVSLDGNKIVHDKNRPTKTQTGSFKGAEYWIGEIQKKYRENPYNFKLVLNALPTTTKNTLEQGVFELIDIYDKFNFDCLSLRFLSKIGRCLENWDTIGYTVDEFLEFYRTGLQRIIDLNLSKKTKLKEDFAERISQMIIAKHPVNHLDFRSPCGAGIGQMAYNWDGDIYTCDEGRMLGNVGDKSFRIGNVKENTYHSCVNCNVVNGTLTSSLVESHPDCNYCVYVPFCGICPVHNYLHHGSIVGSMVGDYRCQMFKGMLDIVIGHILSDSKDVRELMVSWANKKEIKES